MRTEDPDEDDTAAFECVVCLVAAVDTSGPLYQCPEGHLYCFTCWGSLGGSESLCCVCGTAMGVIRCRPVEKHRDAKLALIAKQIQMGAGDVSSGGEGGEDANKAVGPLKLCSACGEKQTQDSFSGKQWAAKAHARKCKSCISQADAERGAAGPQEEGLASRSADDEQHPDKVLSWSAGGSGEARVGLVPGCAGKARVGLALDCRGLGARQTPLLPSAPQARSTSPQPGERVRVDGLTKSSHLNGLEGLVQEKLPGGRVCLLLDIGKTISVRARNARSHCTSCEEAGAFQRRIEEMMKQVDFSRSDFNHVIQSMQHHTHHAGVQYTACHALGEMRGVLAMDDLLKTGVLGLIVRALFQHKDCLNVQEQACFALSALTQQECNANVQVFQVQNKIVAEGGVTQIISSMTHHNDNTVVLISAFQALNNITAQNNAVQTRVALEGGIQQMFLAMTRHSQNAHLQGSALCTLRALSANNHVNKVKMVEAGAVGLIADVMKLHASHAEVQHSACGLLINLVGCSSTPPNPPPEPELTRYWHVVHLMKERGVGSLARRATLNTDATPSTMQWAHLIMKCSL